MMAAMSSRSSLMTAPVILEAHLITKESKTEQSTELSRHIDQGVVSHSAQCKGVLIASVRDNKQLSSSHFSILCLSEGSFLVLAKPPAPVSSAMMLTWRLVTYRSVGKQRARTAFRPYTAQKLVDWSQTSHGRAFHGMSES